MLIVAILAIVALATGVFLGKPVARYAARRATKVNPPVDVDQERVCISLVLQSPGLYPGMALLEPEMFIRPEHQEIWKAVKDVVKEANDGKDVVAKGHLHLRKLGSRIPETLAEDVKSRTTQAALVDELAQAPAVKLSKALKSGGRVMGGWDDRTTHIGDLGLTVDVEDETHLHREYREPSQGRVTFARIVLGVFMAASVVLCGFFIPFATTLGAVLGAVALMVLAVTGLAVALVDYDTLYLETQAFLVLLIASFVPAALAALAEGRPGSIVTGYLSAVLIGIFFILINKAYARIRHREGMGLGDSYIVLASLGVPAVVTGDYYTFLFAFIGGSIAGVLSWVILRLSNKATKDTPYALGPGLALGWILAWPIGYVYSILDEPISRVLAPVLEPLLRLLGII